MAKRLFHLLDAYVLLSDEVGPMAAAGQQVSWYVSDDDDEMRVLEWSDSEFAECRDQEVVPEKYGYFKVVDEKGATRRFRAMYPMVAVSLEEP